MIERHSIDIFSEWKVETLLYSHLFKNALDNAYIMAEEHIIVTPKRVLNNPNGNFIFYEKKDGIFKYELFYGRKGILPFTFYKISKIKEGYYNPFESVSYYTSIESVIISNRVLPQDKGFFICVEFLCDSCHKGASYGAFVPVYKIETNLFNNEGCVCKECYNKLNMNIPFDDPSHLRYTDIIMKNPSRKLILNNRTLTETELDDLLFSFENYPENVSYSFNY